MDLDRRGAPPGARDAERAIGTQRELDRDAAEVQLDRPFRRRDPIRRRSQTGRYVGRDETSDRRRRPDPDEPRIERTRSVLEAMDSFHVFQPNEDVPQRDIFILIFPARAKSKEGKPRTLYGEAYRSVYSYPNQRIGAADPLERRSDQLIQRPDQLIGKMDHLIQVPDHLI
jgi:hypothetical protein